MTVIVFSFFLSFFFCYFFLIIATGKLKIKKKSLFSRPNLFYINGIRFLYVTCIECNVQIVYIFICFEIYS